jgi:hypothetical protein
VLKELNREGLTPIQSNQRKHMARLL